MTNAERALLESYRRALEEIADLRNKTKVRGDFFDVGVPDHLVDADGFVPMPPGVEVGLKFAAAIARKALGQGKRAKA